MTTATACMTTTRCLTPRLLIRSISLLFGWLFELFETTSSTTFTDLNKLRIRKASFSVAASPVVLRWLCDSPRTGCAWRKTLWSMWREQAIIEWSLLLLAATVRSSAHMPLGISDRNKMVLWPGCGGRAEFSLHTKNVRSVRFVVKRRGCCCNLSGGVALIVWFTTNGMCGQNNTIHICGANKQ